MTVLLVIATFSVFILIDAVMNRKRVPVLQTAEKPQPVAMATDIVGGFRIPENLRYHPGHAWALRERNKNVRVGADDFAAALAGNVEKIEAPRPGQWVRQGQKAWTLYRNGEKTEMVSPIEGEVVEVNEEVLSNPHLLRDDPYGQGWLMTVFAPDEKTVERNLLPQSLVPAWMREAVDRLYSHQPELAGAVAADGGTPVRDIAAAMPGTSWIELTREFFLP